jgi:hypothetical protein
MTTKEQYKNALQKIKDECGHVCQEFEICDHIACNDSHKAWAIADQALNNSQYQKYPYSMESKHQEICHNPEQWTARTCVVCGHDSCFNCARTNACESGKHEKTWWQCPHCNDITPT